MCALQPRESKPSDEERRRAVLEAIGNPELDDSQVTRIMRMHLPWKDWLYSEFLRYWFWLGFLALNAFALTELARVYDINDAIGIVELMVLFVLFLALEYRLYKRFWPVGALTDVKERRW